MQPLQCGRHSKKFITHRLRSRRCIYLRASHHTPVHHNRKKRPPPPPAPSQLRIRLLQKCAALMPPPPPPSLLHLHAASPSSPAPARKSCVLAHTVGSCRCAASAPRLLICFLAIRCHRCKNLSLCLLPLPPPPPPPRPQSPRPPPLLHPPSRM